MALRLGDLLVRSGELTEAQRDAVLEYQALSGRPFGEIAERLFGVEPRAVEDAWAVQYASIARMIDPRRETIDRDVLGFIDRRQAWQFRVMPLRFDGEELMVATTREHLVRALKFTGWKIAHACYFVISEALPLGEALNLHYPMAGMTPEMVRGDLRAAG